MSRAVSIDTRSSSPTTKENVAKGPIRILWLDSPDVDRSDMVAPFMPSLEKITREQVIAVSAAPGFDTLPRILVPRSRSKLKPPVFHFGWEVNVSLLLGYAKAKNIPVMQTPRRYMPEKYGSSDESGDESWKGVLLDTREQVLNKTVDDLHPIHDATAYHLVLKGALLGLIREVDPNWPDDMSSIKRVRSAGGPLLMSLFTNYKLRKAPSVETVEAIGRKLGQTTQPKWYLDQWNWKWRHQDGHRLYYL